VAQRMLFPMPPIFYSITALRGHVRPKQYGRKSTAAEAVAFELGSPHHSVAVDVW